MRARRSVAGGCAGIAALLALLALGSGTAAAFGPTPPGLAPVCLGAPLAPICVDVAGLVGGHRIHVATHRPRPRHHRHHRR